MSWIVGAVACAGAVGAALGWLVTSEMRVLHRVGAAVLGWSFAIVGAAAISPSEVDAELLRAAPAFVNEDGYVGSDACRSCHPGQYASWSETYHHTMTQLAEGEAVEAPFDGRILTERGRVFSPLVANGRYYVVERQPDATDPLVATGRWWEGHVNVWRVAMTTGSHHLQAYWVYAASDRLEQFPFVFLIRERRWMANAHSFLQPPPEPDEPLHRYVWGDECAVCHTTGGPWDGPEERAEEVAVTELGISCEACHGPAAEHVRLNRSPARRYQQHASEEGDLTIENARRLEHDRSSSVCGRCHAIHPEDPIGEGLDAFLPGDALSSYTDVTSLFRLVERARVADNLEGFTDQERDDIGAFWDDGTVRVAGREYSGMVRSGCYEAGEMACTSCHSLHRGPRSRQMDPDVAGDAMCTSCHAELASDVEGHTHHAAASEGSRCASCHMPHSSYGLLSGTRSHRMDGPTVSGVTSKARPNACNLCHLDRSLGWTADHLADWYAQPRPTLSARNEAEPAGPLWMLSGDAAQRGVAAWHTSRAEEAADPEVLRPALALMMEDPYSAVRQLAGRAVLDLDPDAPVDLDLLTREPSTATREALLTRWSPEPDTLSRYLVLQSDRDETPTWVSE
ncbi:MAG: cytochrome c3 family protein [Sandaracinaceae bacterium]